MTDILHPGTKFPNIDVPILDGAARALFDSENTTDWQMVIVYRGAHCPLCTRYLQELNASLNKFTEIGVKITVVSADNESQAREQTAPLNLRFDVGYDLSIPQMESLGLFISGVENGQNVQRPFAEPGLFVIAPNGDIRILDISNVPFARPAVASMLMGINYLRQNEGKFPINGTYAVA